MASDMFLKIEKVKGEAQDDKHKDEIDVLAWSWGMSQSGTTHTGSGGGGGKVAVQDMSFTKYIDKSSPTLLMACSRGDHFTKATLVVRKAGGKTPLEYLTIVMSDVIVTSVSTGGSPMEDQLTENVTLNFSEVDVAYQAQKKDGGKDGGEVKYGWDIASNKAKGK